MTDQTSNAALGLFEGLCLTADFVVGGLPEGYFALTLILPPEAKAMRPAQVFVITPSREATDKERELLRLATVLGPLNPNKPFRPGDVHGAPGLGGLNTNQAQALGHTHVWSADDEIRDLQAQVLRLSGELAMVRVQAQTALMDVAKLRAAFAGAAGPL